MTSQEDARILLVLVDRHLRALRLNLAPAFPDEEWGFTAQQAVEKLLKARIVLADQRPPFTHLLSVLAPLAAVELPNVLLALQPKKASRREILESIDALRCDLETRLQEE